MKKYLYLIILLIITFSISSVLAYDSVDDTDIKVYDFANKLSRSEERELQEIAEDFLDKYNMDMVIVTVNYGYNASQIEAYADDFYDYNGFGYGKTNDGIIIAIETSFEDTNDYYIAVETTGEAIERYSDADIDLIFDHLRENKKDGIYEMIIGFTEDAVKYRGYPPNVIGWFLLFFLPLLISGLTITILRAKNKLVKKATTAEAYLDKDKIEFTRKEDKFITTHVTRVPISTGSSGGHSSTHFGSSGVSHGGGGRHV